MSITAERRIPLTLLGGFLGSGKTTWLRHQLHHGKMPDALIVVNEAANVPVDDLLLYRSLNVWVLAGGCACCEGLEDLVQLLRKFCDQRVGSDYAASRFRRVILETSGLADPAPIAEAIQTDNILQHHIFVREIIVAVDAVHGLGYLAAEPLARCQVETADRIIITKTDVSDIPETGRLAATLHRLSPGASISSAVMGSPVDMPDHSQFEPEILADHAGSDDRPILSTVLELDSTTDWTAFGIWLSALLHTRGDDIIRVKGVIRTPSGRLLLQSVRKSVQSPEIIPDDVAASNDDNSVVFIGRGFRPRDLGPSLRRFTGIV